MFKPSYFNGVKAFFEIIVRCDSDNPCSREILDARKVHDVIRINNWNGREIISPDLIHIFEKQNQIYVEGKEPVGIEGFGVKYLDILNLIATIPFRCSVISYEIYGDPAFDDFKIVNVISRHPEGTVVTLPVRMNYFGEQSFLQLDTDGFLLDGNTSLEFTFKPKSITKISFFSAHEIYRQILRSAAS